jgi:hypothetical protein
MQDEEWKVGMDVMANPFQDRKYYPARIIAHVQVLYKNASTQK